MKPSYNFDNLIDRRNTGSVKWDSKQGNGSSDSLIPFWIADMDFEVAPCIAEAISKRLEHPVYGYSLPPQGYKDAVCSWYKKRHSITVEPEWIVPAQHAVTALAMALRAFTKPGDICAVLCPAYDPFFQIVKGADLELLMVPMTECGQHYEVNPDALERCFTSGVKCLLFCNPHNPGGKAWKKEELSAIAHLCKKYDVTILSDDVHCDWVFAKWGYTPFFSLPEAAERTVTVTSPGKTFNVAGFCVSNFIIPDEDMRRKVQAEMAAMFVKGPNMFGFTGTQAAYAKAEEWVNEVRSYVYENLCWFREQMEKNAPGLHVFDQESTFMLWIDCREADPDSAHICTVLSEKYGILVNDGSAYGLGGKGFIRVNAACPRATLQICVDALLKWYKDTVKI